MRPRPAPQAFEKAGPIVLEPIMKVEVEVPDEYQGAVVGDLTRRKGAINNVETRGDGFCVISCDMPLARMFGYSTELRSMTQGKGEYNMEYKGHQPMSREDEQVVIKNHQEALAKRRKGGEAEE